MGNRTDGSSIGGTSSTGTLEFGSSVASGQTIDFAHIGDTLLLDQAQSFNNGTVVGLAAASRTSFDAIDLANFDATSTMPDRLNARQIFGVDHIKGSGPRHRARLGWSLTFCSIAYAPKEVLHGRG